MIEDRVVVGLAARAAERIFTGAVSTGAGGSTDSDLGSATLMIGALHASFGMGDDLVYLGAGDELLREIAMNSQLRARVERHLRELEARAEDLVRKNRDAILAVADRLAIRRYLRGDEITKIMQSVGNATSGKPAEFNQHELSR
jgi:ATP-dependent Zn protease